MDAREPTTGVAAACFALGASLIEKDTLTALILIALGVGASLVRMWLRKKYAEAK